MTTGKLQRSKDQGGLGVRNLQLDHWGTRLLYLYEWVNLDLANTGLVMSVLLALRECPLVSMIKVK